MRSMLTLAFTLLLSACAGSTGTDVLAGELNCPANSVVVCRNGTDSKIKNASRRDVRFCECQRRDRLW